MTVNTRTEKVKYTLQSGNVIDLVAEGYTTITTGTITSALLYPNYKLVLDVSFSSVTGEDERDNLAIAMPEGFNYQIMGGTVKCTTAIVDSAVQLYKDSDEITGEADMETVWAQGTFTSLSDKAKTTFIGGSDTLNILSISTGGGDGIIALDIIPV